MRDPAPSLPSYRSYRGVDLAALADQVRRLAPCHLDPERFRLDKSEIERELRRLAGEPRRG